MKWEKIKEWPAYEGYRKILRRAFRLPDGRVEEFDVKNEGNPICVLALTRDQQVILFKQFRPGPEQELLELPGGGIEKGEKPEDAVARELLEETGHKGKVRFVGRSRDCAYSTMHRYNFVATECEKITEPQRDENEFGEVVLMSLGEFRKHLRSGELTDIETGYLGLDYLGLLGNC